MPKITKKQLKKLRTYIALASIEKAVEILVKCGYYYKYSNLYNDFGFCRIDSVNWAQQVKKLRKSRLNKGYFLEDTLYNDGEFYLKYLSTDRINLDDLNIDILHIKILSMETSPYFIYSYLYFLN